MAVEQLAEDYASQPVIFIEYDVDSNDFSQRESIWWTAYGGGSVTLPMVMVDSGNQINNGYVNFASVYKGMVDAALAREAQAAITATANRVGDTLHFDVDVTNRSGIPISSANAAKVWVIVYEEFASPGGERLTSRYVRAVTSVSISPELANDASGSYSLDTPALSGVDWNNLRAIVLVDYRPDGSSAYDMLQAVRVSSFSQK
ncbi:MAG: hypothetical protein ACOYYS_00605 [Chloroflexota bacterium]